MLKIIIGNYLDSESKLGNIWENFVKRHSQLKAYFVAAAVLLILVILLTVFVSNDTYSSSNSITNCNNIILSSYKNNCILLTAENQSAPSLCNYLPSSLQGQCTSYIAEKTLNESLCVASGSSYVSDCTNYIAYTSNSGSVCLDLNASDLDYCLSLVAIKDNNTLACYSTNNTNASSLCNESLNINLALKTGNISYCKDMSTVANKTISSKILTDSQITLLPNTNNSINFNLISPISYLESIQNTTYSPSDICYFAAITTSGNTTYCAKIQNQTISSMCTSLFKSNNTENNISNKTISQNKTLLNLTKFNFSIIGQSCANYSNGNNAYCSNIQSIIKSVAEKNITSCPNSNLTVKYQCYYIIAKAYNDTNYCSYILNASENSACVSAITQNTS